jgi:hypothetical protein
MDRDRQHELGRRSVLRAMGAGATVSGLGATGDDDGLAALLSVEDPATPGAEMAAAMNEWFGARALVQNEQCAYPTGGGLVGEAHDFELYGPTDVNAQTSNGSLAVGISDEGTLTVFRWPRPSFYDQLKYKTSDRDAPSSGTDHGKFGAYPNAGAFLGLVVERGEAAPTLTWLREDDWSVDQAYTDADADPTDLADSVRTTFRHDDLGLTVVVRDVVAAGDADRAGDPTRDGDDVLVRDVTVERDADSPVTSARLAAFENLNLVVSKKPKSPTRDWCEEEENQDRARYLPGADAVVHERADTDTSTGEFREVAVAMGFAGESDGHQVGGDAYEPTATPAGRGGPTQDAYDDLRDGTLRGNDEFVGQTTGALVADLEFGGEGDPDTATEQVLFAAAETATGATALVDEYRDRSFAAVDREKRAWIETLLDDPPLPDTDDTAVLALCKRALVSLVTSYDPQSGAVVASICTQSPYGEDWVRDGAFFNYGLGVVGLDDWVAKRNRWYADIQQAAEDPEPTYPDTPPGNWPMNHYADGVAGGPIDWEIDETAYGLWTIVDHYELTGDEAYLEAVWPAVQRAADFLAEWKDPRNNLQGHASEDDHPEPTQSIIGAATVWLGLGSAVTAAEALGKDEQAAVYRGRRSELADAVERLLYAEADPSENRPGFYGKKKGFPMAPLAWPICWDDYDTHRMRNHLHAVWQQISTSFAEPAAGEKGSGLYEAKGLVPLAQATRNSPVSAPDLDGEVTGADVKAGIDWIANRHATPDTHIMGEIWIRRETEDGPEVKTTISQPHIWEQILFYLAALEAYPPSDDYDLALEESCGGVIDQLRDIETNGRDPGQPEEWPPNSGEAPNRQQRAGRGDGDGDAGDSSGTGGGADEGPSFPWPMPDSLR